MNNKYLLPALSAIGAIAVISLVIMFFVSPKKIEADDDVKPTPTSSTVPVVVEPQIIVGVKSILHEDKTNGIKFWYPQTAEIKQNEGNFLYATKNGVGQVFLTSTMFTGTNLGQAVVAFGIDSGSAVATCQQAINGDQAMGMTTIAGKDFSTFIGTDAGAGNLYDYRSYRRAQNGKCYEISEVLHSGNIANYEPGAVKEFDKVYFSGVLDKIASSFEFVN